MKRKDPGAECRECVLAYPRRRSRDWTGRMTEGFGFPFGCVAAVAAVIVADLAGATGHPWYALVTLGAAVLAFASRSSPLAATGVAVVAWALHTGFVLGRLGELTFDHASGLA